MAIRLVHTLCGDTAFFYDDMLVPGTALRAEKATLPDGSHPANGMPMKCGSCGQSIPTFDGTVLELEVDPTTATRLDDPADWPGEWDGRVV